MSNAIPCINKRFTDKNSCLALIFNLSNPRMTILHLKIGSRLQYMFKRSIRTHGLVEVSQLIWVLFQQGKISAALQPFCVGT